MDPKKDGGDLREYADYSHHKILHKDCEKQTW